MGESGEWNKRGVERLEEVTDQGVGKRIRQDLSVCFLDNLPKAGVRKSLLFWNCGAWEPSCSSSPIGAYFK